MVLHWTGRAHDKIAFKLDTWNTVSAVITGHNSALDRWSYGKPVWYCTTSIWQENILFVTSNTSLIAMSKQGREYTITGSYRGKYVVPVTGVECRRCLLVCLVCYGQLIYTYPDGGWCIYRSIWLDPTEVKYISPSRLTS
jgi:hypothetical protein